MLFRLGGGWQNTCYGLAEEAHQSLDVLCSRCQEELLAHELQSPQAQAKQPDLILEFRKPGFHLLSLPLCASKLRRTGQLAGRLPSRLVHVDGEKTKG